jgi:ubiquinone biosynthesis protein
MLSGLRHSFNLLRAGRTLAAYDALMTREQINQLPALARFGTECGEVRNAGSGEDSGNPAAAALATLGPSYIKLGQFLATRPDLVGVHRAFDLKSLQDRLPPFAMDEAKRIIRNNLGADVETLFR